MRPNLLDLLLHLDAIFQGGYAVVELVARCPLLMVDLEAINSVSGKTLAINALSLPPSGMESSLQSDGHFTRE